MLLYPNIHNIVEIFAHKNFGCITGVSGLMKILAKDKVLPMFLAATNSRGAAYVSIIAFVLISMSLFVAIFNPTNPTAIVEFGGVYAIAFLSVLLAFVFGTMLLKLYRAQLARMIISKWWEIFISFSAIFIGLVGE